MVPEISFSLPCTQKAFPPEKTYFNQVFSLGNAALLCKCYPRAAFAVDMLSSLLDPLEAVAACSEVKEGFEVYRLAEKKLKRGEEISSERDFNKKRAAFFKLVKAISTIFSSIFGMAQEFYGKTFLEISFSFTSVLFEVLEERQERKLFLEQGA